MFQGCEEGLQSTLVLSRPAKRRFESGASLGQVFDLLFPNGLAQARHCLKAAVFDAASVSVFAIRGCGEVSPPYVIRRPGANDPPRADAGPAQTVAEGATVSDEDLLRMDWYVMGVEGKVPK